MFSSGEFWKIILKRIAIGILIVGVAVYGLTLLCSCGPVHLHVHLKTDMRQDCPAAEADEGLVIELPERESPP